MANNIFALFFVFVVGLSAQAQTKGYTFQGVIKRPDGTFPNVTGTTVNMKVLSPAGCVLRDEDVSGVNITDGYMNLVVGKGIPTANDPGLTIQTVFDNSGVTGGLHCLDGANSTIATNQTYNAGAHDARKLRISLVLDSNPVVLDFNMRAVPFATNAETLNGKSDTDFVKANSAQGVTQSNLESIFNRFTKLDAILNNFNSAGNGLAANISGNAATATTAGNVTGVVAIANGGTGASNVSGARTNLGLGPLATMSPTGTANGTTYLRGDGTWATVSAGGGGTITEVAAGTGLTGGGTTGSVTLNLNNVGTAGTYTKVTTDAQGRVTTGTNLVASDIPALDTSKITTGTFADSFLAGLSIDKLLSATGKYFDYKPNGIACSNGQTLIYTSGTGWGCSTPAVGSVASVAATAPLASSGGSTPTISISQATTSTSGYLSSTDWNTFSGKQGHSTELDGLSGISSSGILQRTGAGTYTTLGVTAPLNITAGNIALPAATSSVAGYLTAADWTLFNSKQGALGFTPLNPANNLSDLGNVTTARTNLGLGGAALLNVGTTAGTVAAGNDSRLVNAIQNAGSGAGNVITSIQAGNTAGRPAVGTDGRLYVDTQAGVIYRDNGSAWVVVASSGGSGGTITGVTAGTGLSGGGATGSVTLNLSNVGTAGTYTKVTTDSQGRVTVGDNLVAADIPSLDYSKITTGKPTTISGYGITDAVKNVGSGAGHVITSLQSGDTASRPTVGTDGRLYIDTQAGVIYRDNGSAWIVVASSGGSGGTITGVTAGTGLTGGGTTGAVTVNFAPIASNTLLANTTGGSAAPVSTTISQILDTVGSSQGSVLYRGASGWSVLAPGTSGQFLQTQGASSNPQWASPSVTGFSGTLSGDVTGTQGATSVDKIKGKAVVPVTYAAAQVLRYDGNNWVNATLSSADISDSGDYLKAANMPANCSANQTLTFSSPSGAWLCSTITGIAGESITTGTIAAARLPASASYWGAATGGIGYSAGNVGIGNAAPAAALEITSSAAWSNGWKNNLRLTSPDYPAMRFVASDSGKTSMIGNNGDGSLWLNVNATGDTSGTSGMVIKPDGAVGVGVTAPTAKLQVQGQIVSNVKNAGSGVTINWNDGNVQYTSAGCGAITFSNMLEGGSYTLIVTGATAGTCTFSQASPDTLSYPASFKFLPANAPTTASKTTIFTFLRAGNIVYVNWATGY